jgi:hypothetical protein
MLVNPECHSNGAAVLCGNDTQNPWIPDLMTFCRREFQILD